MIVALGIEDMLHEIGCTVVGPAYSVGVGHELAANEQLDAAVLDLNVAGDLSEPVAQVLKSRGIPFCFSTGYGSSAVPEGFLDRPVLQKPYTREELEAVLLQLVG